MRERSRRALRSQTIKVVAVGRRGRGPSDQEEQRAQRTSFADTFHTRVPTQQQQLQYVDHRDGLGCSSEKSTK